MKKKKQSQENQWLDLESLENSTREIRICPGPLDLKSDVGTRLRKNTELFRNLEKEWEEAQAERRIRNQQLEAEGHETLEQKVKALHDKLAKEQGAIPEEFLANDPGQNPESN